MTRERQELLLSEPPTWAERHLYQRQCLDRASRKGGVGPGAVLVRALAGVERAVPGAGAPLFSALSQPMQIVIHVMVNPTVQASSFRKAVIDDLVQNPDHQLTVEYKQKRGRKHGWAKIKANGCPGALNIEWDNDSKTLIGRAVTKGDNQPDILLAFFVRYLIYQHSKDISAIVIRTL